MGHLKFDFGAVCDVGMQRTNNEDNFFVPGIPVKEKNANIFQCDTAVYDNSASSDKENTFFALCDGMGGHNAGEVASYLAMKYTLDSYGEITKGKKYQEIVDTLNDFLDKVSNEIYDQSCMSPDKRGMGCTYCGLYFFGGNKVLPVNVGDSRIYELKGGKLVQLSVDHTDTKTGKGALTRYIGMPSDYGAISGEFPYKEETIVKKSRYLMCSDGLTDMVTDDDILTILSKKIPAKQAAEELTDTAKKRGGVDNITVMVIDATPVGKKVSRALLRPVTYVVAGAILATAGGGGYAYYRYTHPETVVREGVSLDSYKTDLQNAKTVEEKLTALNSMVTTAEDNLKIYSDVKKSCDDKGITGDSVTKLGDAITSYSTTLEDIKTKRTDIENAASNEEKLNLFDDIDTLADSLEKYRKDAEDAKTGAKKALDDKAAAERAAQQEKEKQSGNDSGNGGNGAKPSKPAPSKPAPSKPAPSKPSKPSKPSEPSSSAPSKPTPPSQPPSDVGNGAKD